ncbi:SpoIIE family protein phosphatase [Actinokineospora auranticolor]|nr:SpoIIE family protein phosphatase [Actinokineospora auranticolor]
MGDVVGHGVAASATMGQLRVLLADRLAATGDVLAALQAVDAATDRIRGSHAATVCVVILNPRTGELHYSTAGHPPPLVVPADGEARFLAPTGTGPLGVGAHRGPNAVGDERLKPGDLVLLYSDGILERPGREVAESTVELARVAADATADRVMRGDVALAVERACTQTVELLTRVTGHTDDITLLAAQLTKPPKPFGRTVLATHDSLPALRRAVDEWLAEADVDQPDSDAVRHAVIELAANATEHAHIDSPDPHSFTVTGELSDTGVLSMRVTDQGRWREPRPSADRGIGLHMTRKLVATLRVEHDEHGTTATIGLRLTRPAKLITADDTTFRAPTHAPQSAPLLVLEQPTTTPRIRVDGPIDATTASTVEHQILTGSTGARSLTIDLTGVTHLASAGVAALHRLTALHRDNNTELRLYARSGTNADTILTLVALPHATQDPDTQPADNDI